MISFPSLFCHERIDSPLRCISLSHAIQEEVSWNFYVSHFSSDNNNFLLFPSKLRSFNIISPLGFDRLRSAYRSLDRIITPRSSSGATFGSSSDVSTSFNSIGASSTGASAPSGDAPYTGAGAPSDNAFSPSA